MTRWSGVRFTLMIDTCQLADCGDGSGCGKAGMKLVERPEPQGAGLASL
jgi:hypothetical protein